MPNKKNPSSPSPQDGPEDKLPVKKSFVIPEIIEPPDSEIGPDVPFEIEPDFEPPWF